MKRPSPAYRRDPRRVWLDLLEVSRLAVAGTADPLRLRAARKACVGAAFPAVGEAAKAASNGMLELCRVWPDADWRRRRILGPFLLAGATACDDLLALRREEELAPAVAHQRRMMGERED